MSQITIMFVSPLSSDRWGFRRYGSLLLCHWVTAQWQIQDLKKEGAVFYVAYFVKINIFKKKIVKN